MIKNILNEIINIFISGDIVEILILSVLIYYIIKSLKGTRAWVITKALLVLSVVYFVSYFLGFDVIVFIFNNCIGILTTALVIMFQPELRRMLESIGKRDLSFISYFNKQKDPERFSDKTKQGIISSVKDMSSVKTGALIVIELKTPLNEFIKSGIKIDGIVSSQLLKNIFEHNTPLHDGAVIIRENIIKSATSYLPLSQNPEINKDLGTRHRAAIGMSENSDAIIIVVSEETGNISIAKDGKLYHNITISELETYLNKIQKITKEKEKTKSIVRKRNIVNVIISIILGIALWGTIVKISDPIQTKTFTIPVTTTNTDVITDLGKSYEIIEGENTTIEISAKRSIMKELTQSDFVSEANFERLSFTNAVPVTVSAKKYASELDINIKNGGTVIISIDELIDTECPIEVKKIGKETGNKFYENFKTSIEKVVIKGPKNKVKTIDKAIVEYNVNDDQELTQKAKVKIYDKNGNEMGLTDCVLSDEELEVTAEKLDTKEVDINIYSDEYELIDLVKEFDSVKIAAKEIEINKIKEINIKLNTSNVENNKINYLINIEDYLPENTYLIDKNKKELEISCEIEEFVSTTLSFTNKNINIKNGESKKINFLDKKFQINVLHPDGITVDINKIKPYIDIKELEPGEYNLQIQFENLPNIKIESLPSTNIEIEKGE